MKDSQLTQVQQLSEWVHQLKFEDLPEKVVSLSRLQVLDAIAAICAGSRSQAGISLMRAIDKLDKGGPCIAIAANKYWSIENSIYWHSAMINSLELDNFAFMGHFTESSFSVAYAVSEFLNKTSDDFLLALVAAQEASGRISAYMANGPQQGHMRAFVHRTAGAVATAKLLNLDTKEIAHAVAIALSMPEYPVYAASYSADTKVICTAAPAVEGMKAAFLAAEGLSAPLDIVEHPLGFLASFSSFDIVPQIWKNIGQSWLTHTLSFKKYATCAYAQGSVNAAVKIFEQGDYKIEEIERVEVQCPLTAVVLEAFSVPHYQAGLTPVNTHFSTRRSVAAALVFGPITGHFFAEDNFQRNIPDFEKLVDKVSLVHDWELTIQLVKGIDRGLKDPGRPGLLSIGSAGSQLNKFKASVGSRRLFQLNDIIHFLKLKSDDRNYFIRRAGRSFRAKIPIWPNKKVKETYRSSEGDLEKMIFPLGGRLNVLLKDGRRLVHTCNIPSGFAGDPDREQVAIEKYYRETAATWSFERSKLIEQTVIGMQGLYIRELSGIINNEPELFNIKQNEYATRDK